jgi:hypothetical protein
MAISRRELLKRFGVGAASLPLLDAFEARADGTQPPPRRLVSLVIRHGVFFQHLLPWVPSDMPLATASPGSLLMAPSDFKQPVAYQQLAEGTAIDLTPYLGALSPVFSAKWQAIKGKTAFVHNLGCSNAHVQGHTATGPLGGYYNGDLPNNGGPIMTGETIDTVIARKLNGRLPLTLKCVDTWDDVRFLENASSVTVQQTASGLALVPQLINPFATWDQLFASYPPPAPGVRDPRQRRTALLGRALGLVRGIENDRRLSSYDRQRLENHASILEGQRANLLALPPPAAMVAPPARPVGTAASSVGEFDVEKGSLFRAQLKNAAAAIKLNLEQVITIDTSLENEWVTEGIMMGDGYHGNAGHLANPSLPMIETCRQVQQLVFDAVADLITELDVVEDPNTGATYLDNTLVLVAFEHDGRPNGHLRYSLPTVLAGGFGTFKGGRLYEFSVPAARTPDPGCTFLSLSYSRLLYTVLDAFGVTAAERATLDIQGISQDWQGADLTGWNTALTLT